MQRSVLSQVDSRLENCGFLVSFNLDEWKLRAPGVEIDSCGFASRVSELYK
jgi:hypothetical protein